MPRVVRAARRARPVRAAAVAALAAALAACTVAGEELATGAGAAPTTDGPATTDEASDAVSATRLPIDLEESQDDASATRLLPAANGRGDLLVGAFRGEGLVARPAIWESLDGLQWAETAGPVAPEGSQYQLADVAWVGTTLVGVGTVNDGTGARAAAWIVADGRTFGAPELPAGEEPSSLSAVSTAPTGPLVAGTLAEGGELFVAVRDAAGTWTPAELPDVPQFSVRGIASIAATIVLTGVDGSTSPPRAGALVSQDGGVTFALSDAAAFDGEVWTGLGPVVATPAGFVAAACAPADPESVSAIARSADGVTWARQDLTLAGPDAAALDLHGAGCNSIAVEGDVVHLGLLDVGAWTVAVTPDGQATPTRFPRVVGHVPAETPLLAATPHGLLGVGRDGGGFTPVLLTAGLLGVGLPPGRPLLTSVSIDALSDTLMVGASLYPLVTDRPDGSYTWRSYRRWFESTDAASVSPSFTADTIWDVEATPFGDVAFGFDVDPADAGGGGPGNATAWYVRAADRTWAWRGLLASGPGGEQISAGASSDAATVAVGQSALRDAATNVTTTRPLASVTTDGQTWVAEDVPLDPATNGVLRSVCAFGDRFVALGATLGADAHDLVAVRDAGGAWSLAPPEGLAVTLGLDGCAALEDTVVVFRAGGRPAVYTSDDLATFTESDTSGDDLAGASFGDVQVVDGRFVAVGSVADRAGDRDGALWTSTDGEEWTRLDVDGLGGPGDQVVQGVAQAPAGSVVVSGMDNGAAVLWTLPADAW